MKKKGISFGEADGKGRLYYEASQVVSVDPTNAQWGKARVLAFDKALLEAKGRFLQDMFGRQVVEESLRMFEDSSDGAREFKEEQPTASRIKAIAEKALVLQDAKLNAKLEDLGIDPEEFSAKSPAQKKTFYAQEFTKTANCWGVENNRKGTNTNRIAVFRKS